MSEKVKLPKAVCEALDKANVIYDECTIIYKVLECSFFNELGVLCDVDANLLMRALVLGYEHQMTEEEQIKYNYDNPIKCLHDESINLESAYRQGIEDALDSHGIQYSWFSFMQGDAE